MMSTKVIDQAVAAASGEAPAAAAPAKVTPKPGELKALFAQYEATNAAVAKASAAYDTAMANRSKVVELFSGFGQAFTAPNGDRLTVTKRLNKETGVTAYYFKGPGKAEALKID